MNDSYEIELKSLLTGDKYDELSRTLPSKMKMVSDESIVTHKFHSKNNDIRLRHSMNSFQLVFKDGSATDISRKEITISLNDISDIERFILIFKSIGLEQDPSWITHRKDFEYEHKGHIYFVSLQYTENFAHIMEIEYLSDSNDPEETLKHENNIKEIFTGLGCEPIDNKEFQQKIKEYIRSNGHP